MQIEHQLTVYLPDTRGVVLSRYGKGNLKIGAGVFTYSRLPGRPYKQALGTRGSYVVDQPSLLLREKIASWPGTCPGSTPACEQICVTATTRVLTEDLRWTALRDLDHHVTLLGFKDGNPGRIRRYIEPTTITSLSFEQRKLVRVIFQSGRSIVTTPEHQWLARVGSHRSRYLWVTSQQLAPGQAVPRFFDTWDPDLTRSASYLAGLFDGEGYLCRTGQFVGFSQKPGIILDETLRLLQEKGFDPKHYHAHPGRSAAALRISQANALRFLGSVRPLRLLASRKYLGVPMSAVALEVVDSVDWHRPADVGILETSLGTFIAEGFGMHNCYARRPVEEMGPVAEMWHRNSVVDDVPPIPKDAKLLRIHVGGDFDTKTYIENWIARLTERPDVTTWAYTRSWRAPELLPALERLRALPNVQLFASMDKSHTDEPPAGWRRAWIDGDPRGGEPLRILAHTDKAAALYLFELERTKDGVKSLVCPEETGAVRNCEECGFCFAGPRNDVTFLEH